MGTPLPPGWRSAIDPKHNREYYFDQSGNVQWTVPTAAPAPAAAAAPAAAPAAAAAESSTPAAAATSAADVAAPSAAAAAPAASGEESLFKKPKRNKNVRARPSASDAGDESGSAVVRKAAKVNPMVQSTATGARNRDALGMEFAQPSDVRISTYDNKVCATNEQDTEKHLDAQAQYEEAQRLWKSEETDADGKPIYRGQKAYKPYTAKAESFEAAMMNGAGPARAPVHYRATSRIDYTPDVCKDFKDTGYCGYGDACKFLHDRSDYKSGWQLDKMWEEEQKELKHQEALVALGEAEAAKKTDPADHLPFACLICREPWHAGSNPVQTKCEHYFCERCAIEHFQKSRRCFACSEQTGGVFNKAKAIQEKIDRLKAAEEVASAEDMTQEQLNAEYEASKESSKRRGYTGGWGYVG